MIRVAIKSKLDQFKKGELNRLLDENVDQISDYTFKNGYIYILVEVPENNDKNEHL
jgi:hypothetical protein